MRGTKALFLTAAATLAATGAHAGDLSIAGLVAPRMTYTSSAAVTSALTSAYNGVGSIFVQTASTAPLGQGFLCTASLINSYTALSAAHCVYDHDEETGALDPVVSVRFYLPSFGDRNSPGVEIYTASSFQYNPLYDNPNPPIGTTPHTGDIGSGYDVSLITLSQLATGHETYQLYTGNSPLGQYLEVGTGTTGGPTGTSTGAQDYKRRIGTNLFELYGDDLFSDVTHGVVLSDFDDGTAEHDVFGNLTIANSGLNAIRQTGIAGESNSSPGDSGGPEFNAAGQIVSVTSFGITGGILQGYCGTNAAHPTAIDPNRTNAAGTQILSTYTTNLNLCTNSSVGEIAGDTLVSYNIDFINSYLAAHPFAGAVPEPASWALLIGGFGMIGGMARRRRATVSVRYA